LPSSTKNLANERIRLYFDENMPVAVAKSLNERGIDTATAQDRKRLGYGDPSQLNFAIAQGRVLCTFDKHYISMASEGVEHKGIVFVPGLHRDHGVLLRYFIELCRIYTAADMVNRLEYLSPATSS